MPNYMKRFFSKTTSILLIFLVIAALQPEASYARPGGGHSYSSTKKKSSSSSKSTYSTNNASSEKKSSYWDDVEVDKNRDVSDVDLPDWIAYAILIVIVIVLAWIGINSLLEKNRNKTLVSAPSKVDIKEKQAIIAANLRRIKAKDPNFSNTLFFDFVSSIFTKYYALHGTKEFKNLSPYLTPEEIIKHDKRKTKKEHTEIVIGSMNINTVYPGTTLISVDIAANYTLVQKGKRTRYEVVERWSFKRNPDLLSPVPEKIRELSCPNCGASVGFTDTGTCESCGTLVKNGEMQWFVSSHNKQNQKAFETSGLAHYKKEKGTRFPTVYHPDNEKQLKQFIDNHKTSIDEWLPKFENKVVHEYFVRIYGAWSINKLNSIRHLLTDRLYESYIFWIDAYKEESLTNKLDDLKIKKTELAKIEIDKFYESITVRIHASVKDYVTDSTGKVIGGSARKNRKFSEYWTFIRRTGVETDNYDYGNCPNCSAPADKMGQSGTCGYCNTKISNGDFSWVLAVITQDEVYIG